jgi:hypothetical protein
MSESPSSPLKPKRDQNATGDKSGGKKKNISPSGWSRFKKRLSPGQWKALSADLAISAWLWVYLLESHDTMHLLGFFITLEILYVGAWYFLGKLFKRQWACFIFCALTGSTVSAAYLNRIPEVIPHHEPAWQPPELPPGCQNAYVSFGPITTNIPISVLSQSDVSIPIGLGPPLVVSLTNNRIYIKDVELVRSNETWSMEGRSYPDNRRIDDQLHPRNQRNFNSNAFEMVDNELIPMKQIIYTRPNAITVNAICYGGTIVSGSLTDGTANIQPIAVFAENGTWQGITNFEDLQNKRLQFKTNTIFKYPAWKYPGQLREASQN